MTRNLHPQYTRHFNSQPRKEADLCLCLQTPKPYHFNSQPRKEADDYGIYRDFLDDISIHSLARRLTIIAFLPLVERLYFNSQPRKEADHLLAYHHRLTSHFNSQPRKEADGTLGPGFTTDLVFQFTASQGG